MPTQHEIALQGGFARNQWKNHKGSEKVTKFLPTLFVAESKIKVV